MRRCVTERSAGKMPSGQERGIYPAGTLALTDAPAKFQRLLRSPTPLRTEVRAPCARAASTLNTHDAGSTVGVTFQPLPIIQEVRRSVGTYWLGVQQSPGKRQPSKRKVVGEAPTTAPVAGAFRFEPLARLNLRLSCSGLSESDLCGVQFRFHSSYSPRSCRRC